MKHSLYGKFPRVKKVNMKKKNPNGYLRFTMEQRGKVQRQYPGVKPAEIISILAARWRALRPDQKLKYNSK